MTTRYEYETATSRLDSGRYDELGLGPLGLEMIEIDVAAVKVSDSDGEIDEDVTGNGGPPIQQDAEEEDVTGNGGPPIQQDPISAGGFPMQHDSEDIKCCFWFMRGRRNRKQAKVKVLQGWKGTHS